MLVGIQFLRFVAAASVLIAHSLHQFEGLKPIGVFGVDIFFVISGFIIFYITEKDCSMFLMKRLIRIVPLYWVFTLLLAVVTLILPDLLKSARFDPAHILASLFFIPYWTETTLFSPILKLGWTLNLEMLFYLLFFAAMRVSHKHRGAIASAMLITLFLVLNMLDIDERSALKFYSASMWFEFIFGMSLAMALPRLRTLNFSAATLLCILIIGGSVLILSDYALEGEPVYRVLYWGIPSIFVVASVILLEGRIKTFGAKFSSLSVWLGEMSYPMYLIHIYVIVVIHRLVFKDISAPLLVFVTLAVTLLCSHIATQLYDLPIRRFLIKRVSAKGSKSLQSRALVKTFAESR